VHYAKCKREKKSICNLCREEKALSWDHVPPKGGIEIGRVEMETMFEIMAGDRESRKLRESLNGVKYRTICRDCNSYLGLEYDPVINDFATSVGLYLKTGLALPDEISHKVKPQRLMKALLGHIVAAKVEVEDTTFDRAAREYVLDPNKPLPEEIHVFYWVYPYATSVAIRDFGMFVPRGTFNEPAVFQLLKYYPIAYLCSTKPEYAGLPALSWYRGAELDSEVEISLNLKRVEDPYWPEAPDDEDNNVFFGGRSAVAAVHARPRNTRA
jgi:hypothetical protein